MVALIVSKKNISGSKKEYLYLALLIGFVVMATIISSSFSRDSENYNRMFEIYGVTGWGALSSEMFQRETFFLVVSKALNQLGQDSIFLFLIFAAISLPIKFYLIDKYSRDKVLSLAVFTSYFFILHDSTQIRFSMAVAFAYVGLHYLSKDRKWLFSAIVILSAIAFHVSVLFFIVMLFFTTKKSLSWLLGLIVIAVLLYPLNLNIVFLELVGGAIDYFNIQGTFLNNLYVFLQKPEGGGRFGLFNWRVLLVYFCVAVIYQYRDSFSKYELLCYNALVLSIFVYIFMKDVVEIQYRISGLFGFSLVFLVPYIYQWLSEFGFIGKRNAYVILLSFFTVFLLKFAFYDKMIII